MKQLLLKIFIISCSVLLGHLGYAQNKEPDTLVISTKNGQVILVSDSLSKFAPMELEALIKKALKQASDAMPNDKSLKADQSSGINLLNAKKNKLKMFRITGNFGVALVRDKISPMVDGGIEFAPARRDYQVLKFGMYSFLNLSAQVSSTFREEENKYRMHQNTFLSFTLGNRMNPKGKYKTLTELSGGVGYLIQRNGTYFERNTFKIFINVGLPNSFIKIRPECYLSKDGAFPGLTVSLINITNYF